jgi:hypothetical protein
VQAAPALGFDKLSPNGLGRIQRFPNRLIDRIAFIAFGSYH